VFRDVATGRCLDSNTEGEVYTLGCNGGSFQKWIVVHTDYGTVTLRNLATGFMLDSGPGGDVYTLPANGGSYQKWIATAA
jgi:Ricin-type beta-trefoil lectin domain-like